MAANTSSSGAVKYYTVCGCLCFVWLTRDTASLLFAFRQTSDLITERESRFGEGSSAAKEKAFHVGN